METLAFNEMTRWLWYIKVRICLDSGSEVGYWVGYGNSNERSVFLDNRIRAFMELNRNRFPNLYRKIKTEELD